MPEISAEKKAVVRYAASAFAGDSRVIQHHSDDGTRSYPIVRSNDALGHGIVSYATGGLHEHPMYREGVPLPFRLELVGAALSEFEYFADALGTALIYTMNENWLCAPGVVLEDVFPPYSTQASVKHFYFTAPKLWDGKFNRVMEFGSLRVTWLWALPITEEERRFLRENGDERFEDHLEKQDVPYYDLHRLSSV